MESVVVALVVKPNEKPILQDIFNSRAEIARVVGIDVENLGERNHNYYQIFYPKYLNINFCMSSGLFPSTVVIVNHRTFADFELFDMGLNYTNITVDVAFSVLQEMNVKVDGLLDGRMYFPNNMDVMNFIVNNALHNKEVSLVAKALLVFIQTYNFDITMSRIVEHFYEDISVIEQGLQELMNRNLLVETRVNDPHDRYFSIAASCVNEAKTLLEEFTATSQEPAFIPNENTPSNEMKVTSEKENVINGTSRLDETDYLLEDAIDLVIDVQRASVSMLQRKFKIGYSRAARIVDTLEDLGVVGPHIGSKAREVLVASVEEFRDRVELLRTEN
ncbi:FtsK-like protein [Ureibacillus xyleni]|uniref:FtsK-like protein n=1 Tax=Ureibacillus xyleni TaxID=614648 RepID=A0A285RDT5_9BACL|nr:DNA translocase FtsK [Ureibacillus xyleni]SOB90537.1 FtsK-like protein [Ureibacillus xyleni]